MQIYDFNELQSLQHDYNRRSIPYEEYFDVMDITDEQKKERIKVANELEVVILFALSLVAEYYNKGILEENKQNIINQVADRYSKAIGIYAESVLTDHIMTFSSDLIEITIKHKNEPYFLSTDRAMVNAENEANVVINTKENLNAIASGKTKKQWLTEKDQRVRKTHREVNKTVIPIEEPFVVGESLLMFPKDYSLGADGEEVVNCRCTVKYF